MRDRRAGRPRRQWWAGAALAPLLLGRSPTEVILAATASVAVLIFVLVVAVVALGAAFTRSAERQRACLQVLQTLMRAAPWTCRR